MSTDMMTLEFNNGLQLRTLDDALRFCRVVKDSGLAPSSFTSEGAIFVAIQAGAELGFAPMQSLQSIAVINGRPSLYGDGLSALVHSTGEVEDFREWIDGEGDEMTAYCQIQRTGRETPTVRSFSVADAKQAKLWMKKGRNGKDTPWVTFPQRMLQMRARSWAVRDAFPDALRGLHVVEEVRDIEPEPQRQSVPQNFLDVDAEPEVVTGPGDDDTATVIDAEVEPAEPPSLERRLRDAKTREELEAIQPDIPADDVASLALFDFCLSAMAPGTDDIAF